MTLVFHPERCPDNPLLQGFVAWWQTSGAFPIVITHGDRTDEEQAALYEIGRSRPGKVVTNAPTAALSAHGHSGAIDCQPVRELYPSGGVKLVYLGDEEDAAVRAEADRRLDAYVQAVRGFGLQSGADFPGLHDRPHAQDPQWKDRPLNPGVKDGV